MPDKQNFILLNPEPAFYPFTPSHIGRDFEDFLIKKPVHAKKILLARRPYSLVKIGLQKVNR